MSAPLLQQLVAGHYRVTHALSTGAMGELYAATDETDPAAPQVALKVIRTDLIDERFRRRFAVETEATRRLQHDSIVRLLDSGILEPDDVTRHTGVPFLILELLAGRNLHDELQANGVMPVSYTHLDVYKRQRHGRGVRR